MLKFIKICKIYDNKIANYKLIDLYYQIFEKTYKEFKKTYKTK